MKKILFLILIVFLSACDETTNPSESLIIDSNYGVSSEEQYFESKGKIKLVIPPNALNGQLNIKATSITSVPNFDIKDFKLGTNLFRIKFKGNTTFNESIKISINYLPDLIKQGYTDKNGVRGFVYFKGEWYFAVYAIDEINKKVIFNIEGFDVGKINKNNDILLDSEEDIIIGDGYSTTDQGQSDEFLEKINKSRSVSIKFSGFHIGLNDNEFSALSVPDVFNFGGETFSDTLNWDKNEFSDYRNDDYSIIGTINSQNESASVTAEAYDERTESGDKISVYIKLILEDVPYFTDNLGFIHVFYIDGGGIDISKRVKYVEYKKTIIGNSKNEVYEYKGTDFTKNASLRIEFIHFK